MFSAHPQPTTMSASRISSTASGDANPPEMPRDHGLPSNKPLATALVASNAPADSASRSNGTRALRAPRPAMNTGRAADISAWTRRPTASSSTATSFASGGFGHGIACAGTSAAWTSSGRLSRTVRRSREAVQYAAAASFTADSGEVTLIDSAPTAAASAGWSTWKFDRGDVTSAARTSSGVRLLAASAMPVMALVSPQPWCTDTAATVSLMRA